MREARAASSRAAAGLEKRPVDSFNVNAPLLDCLGRVRDFKELAGGFLRVGEWPVSGVFHEVSLPPQFTARRAKLMTVGRGNFSSGATKWLRYSSRNWPERLMSACPPVAAQKRTCREVREVPTPDILGARSSPPDGMPIGPWRRTYRRQSREAGQSR
jgi:hypothetical protein